MRINRSLVSFAVIALSTIAACAQESDGDEECKLLSGTKTNLPENVAFVRECTTDGNYYSREAISTVRHFGQDTIRDVHNMSLPGQSLFLDPYFLVCKQVDCDVPRRHYFSVATPDETVLAKILNSRSRIGDAADKASMKVAGCTFGWNRVTGIVPYEVANSLGLNLFYEGAGAEGCTLLLRMTQDGQVVDLAH